MEELVANFVIEEQPEINANLSLNVTNTEHDLLSHRDYPDQHPISAITGLQEALDTIPADYVSDAELEAALLEKQDVIRDLSEIRQGATLGATAVQPSELESYATQTWVSQQGYLTEIPAEYVTDSELTAKGYQTAADVETAITAKGYTTMSAVEAKGYITNAALVGYATESYVTTAVGTETTNRQNADNNLQSQIDAITASSDVTDIVGTYAELQSYDTSALPPNSIIKVLQDESRNNETTYYRWVITGGVGAWSLIGEEGPYYTMSAADAKFATQTALSTGLAAKQDTISDLATIRSDASSGANAYTTIQNYGDIVTHNVSEFATSAQGALADSAVQPSDLATVATSGSYNDLSNKPTIPAAQVNSDWNATSGVAQILNKPTIPAVPTNVSAFTNDAGYITSSDLSGYATETWVGQQGYITGITSSDVTTALGYTPYNSSNPNGYTSNVGTVVSVNNTSPDSGGNVTISIPAAQVNSDWNAASGVAQILNKPSLATVATTGAYSDLSGTPSIPTVNNATLTITQGGVSKGTFTANASSDVTIALDAGGGGSSYTAGTGIDITNGVISVDGVTTSEVTLATVATTGAYSDLTGTSGVQVTSNLVTSVSSSSTDTQYPSAKCVYDIVGDVETLINAL